MIYSNLFKFINSIYCTEVKAGLDSRVALPFARSFEENKTYKRGLHSCESVNAVPVTSSNTRADEIDFIMLHWNACTSEQFLVVIGLKDHS